ncbi:MAG: hypothetical protein ABI333_22395 [bacterium]
MKKLAADIDRRLRALIAPDREAVESFLHTHRAELPKRALREVRNKLQSGLKNPKA